ncbi:MAG: serine/threonine-protein kinase [Byssovorax sp.]
MERRHRHDDTRTFSVAEEAAARGELVLGSRAGEYVVQRFIARGGCGSVYEAQHASEGGRAAVKVLHQTLAASPKMMERFSREVKIVNMLRHPSIIDIYEVGTLDDGRPFYVMEYLEGRTLHDLLRAGGRMSPREALEIFEPVCAALSAAHDHGVVHRDVKASNIFVVEAAGGEPRRIKLLDFGIAKLTDTAEGSTGLTSDGRQVGTVTIMAPEQFTGKPVDRRADIYALGILLFRLLTGRLPFDARSPLELARQHMEQPPPRPSQRFPVLSGLDAIVLRCLEKQPDYRFDSIAELMASLRAAVAETRAASDAPPEQRSLGLGIHVELQTPSRIDDLDDSLNDDIGFVLDRVETALRGAGFTLVMSTGTVVFGVRPFPAAPAEARRALDEARSLSRSLHEELLSRPGGDDRLHVDICLHAAEILWKPGSPAEIAGGALLRTEAWVSHPKTSGVRTTPALAGLSGDDETTVVGPEDAALLTEGRNRP